MPRLSSGLILPGIVRASSNVRTELTTAAAIAPEPGEALRVDLLVAEGDAVAQGQPLMRDHNHPGLALVAPMAGRVARIEVNPGRRLAQLVLYHEPAGDRHRHDIDTAESDAAALRVLLQGTGLWRALRSRPFGRVPRPDETAAALFVMACDSRPGAVPADQALTGRTEDLLRGLGALARLGAGSVFFCAAAELDTPALPQGIRRLVVGPLHPQGLAGTQIHRHHPARAEAPVWDIAAEDVADLGALLASGYLAETRLISLSGDALRETHLVRCQPGADLRGLARPWVRPGPHEVFSGSLLDGRAAHWLGPRDRQATFLLRVPETGARHWFRRALERVARNSPIIPTVALDQAFGGNLPAAPLVRALASGDVEAFTRLGGLSMVEEDVALADYATGARPRLAGQLRAMLARIAAEEGAA